jgi:hypothetical protein
VTRAPGGLSVAFDNTQVKAGDTIIIRDGDTQTTHVLTQAEINAGSATVNGTFSAAPLPITLNNEFVPGTIVQTGDFLITGTSLYNSVVVSVHSGVADRFGSLGNNLWVGNSTPGDFSVYTQRFEIRPLSGPVSQLSFTLGAMEAANPAQSSAQFFDAAGNLLGSVPINAATGITGPGSFQAISFTAPAGSEIALVKVTVGPDGSGIVLDNITTTDPGHAPGNFDSFSAYDPIKAAIADPAGNSSDYRGVPGALTAVPSVQTIDATGGLYAGGGDDNVFLLNNVSDLGAVSAVIGNGGSDTLRLTDANQTLDLTSAALHGKLQSVETIDLTGTGNNTLKLSVADVLDLGQKDNFHADGRVQMMVKGNAGDSVTLTDALPGGMDPGDWTQEAGTVTVGGVSYTAYTFSTLGAELLVQEGVTVTLSQTINPVSLALPLALTATADGETLTGTSGSDVLHDGNRAGVTLNGGAGDDVLRIDRAGTVVNGGSGFDELLVTGRGLSLNFDNVRGIEQVDLGKNGGNTLSITLQDVLTGPDSTPKTLEVLGDASDTVKLRAADGFAHTAGDTQTHNGMVFDVWHASSGVDVATLLLQQGVHVTP